MIWNWKEFISNWLNNETFELMVFSEWIQRLSKLVEKYGADFWWELSVEKILGKKLRSELNLNATDFEKGKVWLTWHKKF